MNDTQLVKRETPRERVRLLTLHRPGAYNALSGALIAGLHGALDEAAADPDVGAVVLRGAGPGFCAGHDLKELEAVTDEPEAERLFDACAALMQAVAGSPKPVIAAVHGVATAAGCQLVASCDLAVAAASARFATPGVNLGLFCSTPMVALSRAVARKHALELLLTGELVGAEHAARIGLVNRVVPDGEETEAALELATRIAGRSAETLAFGKALFQGQLEQSLPEAYATANRVMVENLRHEDAREGIRAFLERREPHWRR